MNNSKFLRDCNGWSHMFSSVVIIGADKEQVQHKISEVDSWDYVFYNWKQPSDGSIRFDAYRVYPEALVSLFSKIGPDVVCYASTHWDESYFCAAKGGDFYEDYTAEWVNETPQKCDNIDDAWDCDVLITDIPSGIKISVGGGACTKEDYLEYKRIIAYH